MVFALAREGERPHSDERSATYTPVRARSMAAMSILRIAIIASKTRLAAARSGSFMPEVSATGVICHDTFHLSLHHPQAFSCPSFLTIAS